MLAVEHYIAPSKIHGLGLFARKFIPAGALIWEFNEIIDKEIPEDDLKKLPAHVRGMVMNHAEYFPDRGVYRLGGDGDYFMNHSDTPNCVDAGNRMYAARDIAPGEEIVCDYRVVKVKAFDPAPIAEPEPIPEMA